MREYLVDYKEVLNYLHSSYKGISEEEASIRLKKNGLNKLDEAEKTPIFAVVIINGVLGVYQENKSEKAIEALQKMTSLNCKVIRNNKQITIKSEEIVPGDIVLLEAGDSVPADGRIIESASLKIEEAALTGESVAVTKNTDILSLSLNERDISVGDIKNMVYMGSSVVYGRG